VVTAAAQMVQKKRSLSHMSQPSFGGRRFLLLGALVALGALRFIRTPLGALGENALPFWRPFGIHKDMVHELVVDSRYPRTGLKNRCNSETGHCI
jgi:hypothetical protein